MVEAIWSMAKKYWYSIPYLFENQIWKNKLREQLFQNSNITRGRSIGPNIRSWYFHHFSNSERQWSW